MAYRIARLLLVWTALLLALPAPARPPLKLVANFWGPYTENGVPGQGQAAQLVSQLLAEAGYSAGIEILPWQRALSMAYLGQADGIVCIWSTPERQDKLLFSEPYMVNRISLLHRKGALSHVKSMADLKGLRIGIGLGYDYSPEFLAANDFHKDAAATTLANLKKLLAGRVDAIVEDEAIVDYYRSKYAEQLPGAEQLEFSKTPLMVLPLHFGVSRQREDAAEIISRFNAALREWRARQKQTAVRKP